MKKAGKILIIMLMAMVSLYGCSTQEKKVEASLQGDWMEESGNSFTFQSAGKGTQDDEGITYKISGSKELVITNANGISTTYEFGIKEEKLYLTAAESGVTVIYYKNQGKGISD